MIRIELISGLNEIRGFSTANDYVHRTTILQAQKSEDVFRRNDRIKLRSSIACNNEKTQNIIAIAINFCENWKILGQFVQGTCNRTTAF